MLDEYTTEQAYADMDWDEVYKDTKIITNMDKNSYYAMVDQMTNIIKSNEDICRHNYQYGIDPDGHDFSACTVCGNLR